MLLGKEVSAVSAALGAAVVDPGLDEHIARKAHKVRQTRRRARPPFTRARRAVVRVQEVRLEVVKAHRARHEHSIYMRFTDTRHYCAETH